MSPQELLRKQHAFFHTGQTRDVKYRLHESSVELEKLVMNAKGAL